MREDLANLIDSAAYAVWKRYKSFTEAADLRQEMWVWALAQDEERLTEYEAHKLTWKLRDAGEVYARKEKAAKGGYEPDDEVFYSLRTLRELLPLAVTDVPITLRAVESEGKRSGGTPQSMEFETALADMRRAFKRLSSKYQLILGTYVESPDDADEVAVTRALRFMQRRLGGKRPKREKL